MQALAESKGSTVAQLLLAWLLMQQDYIVSIPGSRNARRVEENVVPLTSHSAPTISPESKRSCPHGAYGPRFMEAQDPQLGLARIKARNADSRAASAIPAL